MNKLLIIISMFICSFAEAGDTYPSIFYAAYNDDIGIANGYILSGESIEIRDKQGRTPLLAAAEIGNKDIFIFLLENGADLKATVNDKTICDIARTSEFCNIAREFNKQRQSRPSGWTR